MIMTQNSSMNAMLIMIQLVHGTKLKKKVISEFEILHSPERVLSKRDFQLRKKFMTYDDAVIGMRIKTRHNYKQVPAGTIGTVIKFDNKIPPVLIRWSFQGTILHNWIHWHDIEMVKQKEEFVRVTQYIKKLQNALNNGNSRVQLVNSTEDQPVKEKSKGNLLFVDTDPRYAGKSNARVEWDVEYQGKCEHWVLATDLLLIQ